MWRSMLTPRWGPKRQKREATCQKLGEGDLARGPVRAERGHVCALPGREGWGSTQPSMREGAGACRQCI